MKSTKILFLFFFINCFLWKHGFTQVINDSLNHYYNLVKNPSKSTDLASAYNFYNKRKSENLSTNNNLKAISDLRMIAIIQMRLGDLYGSEVSAVEALKLVERLKENDSTKKPLRIGLFNHFGKIYTVLEDYDLAIDYYNELLKITKDSLKINIIENNRAFVYYKQKRYSKATDELDEIYLRSLKLNDTLHIARVLDNLGMAQSKLNYPDALSNIQKSLALRKIENSIDGIYTSYNHLVEFFKNTNDEEQSLIFADKAVRFADSISKTTLKFDALQNILRLSDDENTLEFLKMNDSISNAKLKQENKYAKIRYDYTEKEKALQESELNNERQKRTNLIYLFSGLLVLVASIFLYFHLKIKHKKDKIRDAYLKETQFSKKVHDELANDMSDLMNYVKNEINISEEKKSAFLDNLENIYVRTRDISTETGSIDLVNFKESLSNLLLQHNREGTKVVLNDINTINWNKIPDHKKMVIYRCLQELMVNMKKHSQAKLVSIIFKSYNSKNIMHYVDNGVGVSIDKANLSGLQNVESRIKSIHGTFNFTTSKGNGFKATLEFNS